MKDTKIGIIGNGFVGQAIGFGFSPVVPVLIHDKDPLRAMNTLEEVATQCDYIFVCVPTPMNRDGSINLNIVRGVFDEFSEIKNKKDSILIIKSTIVPGTTEGISREFPHLNIVFNPEFLTERTSRFDFINQARIVLGGPKNLTDHVADLYNLRFNGVKIIQTDYNTAEFIKYFNNVFFAVKVSFANEMKRVADNSGVDWEAALTGFISDGRVGYSHLNVPGPDGKLGFGGSCFPKDINAFMTFAKQIDLNVNVVEAAWKTNLEVRPEEDWRLLKGRAITDD